jgi:hypothetical protein
MVVVSTVARSEDADVFSRWRIGCLELNYAVFSGPRQSTDTDSLGLCGVALAGATHGWAVGNVFDVDSPTTKFEGSIILTTTNSGASWKQ